MVGGYSSSEYDVVELVWSGKDVDVCGVVDVGKKEEEKEFEDEKCYIFIPTVLSVAGS